MSSISESISRHHALQLRSTTWITPQCKQNRTTPCGHVSLDCQRSLSHPLSCFLVTPVPAPLPSSMSALNITQYPLARAFHRCTPGRSISSLPHSHSHHLLRNSNREMQRDYVPAPRGVMHTIRQHRQLYEE